jgi:hypothetical protein
LIKSLSKVAAPTITLGLLSGVFDQALVGLIASGLVNAPYGFLLTYYTNSRQNLVAAYQRKERIIIGDLDQASSAGALAHEYTHHIQHTKKPNLLDPDTSLGEGHAWGVGRKIGTIFANRYNNESYLFFHSKSTAIHLHSAFLDNSFQLNNSPIEDPYPEITELKDGSAKRYYYDGVAAVYVAESKMGPKVYRDMIKGDFSFLKNKN